MNSTKELPDSPTSWFYIAKSADITTRPKIFKVGELELVAFRNNLNELLAFQRRCPHMNADLSLGCITSGRLQCSLHRWEFNSSGKCDHIPNQKNTDIPDRVRLKSYPIVERGSLIFVFNNESKLFELPFFPELEESEYTASAVKVINTENEWFVGAANAFDLAHFETVHFRNLLETPKILEDSNYSYRIQLEYEIKGKRFSDRLMKFFFGAKASLDFTVFAGNFILAKTNVKEFKNYMMIVSAPNGKNKSLAYLVIYSKKTLNPLKILKQILQAELSRKFFQDEADTSRGVFIDIKTLGASDQVLGGYLRWLMNLYDKSL